MPTSRQSPRSFHITAALQLKASVRVREQKRCLMSLVRYKSEPWRMVWTYSSNPQDGNYSEIWMHLLRLRKASLLNGKLIFTKFIQCALKGTKIQTFQRVLPLHQSYPILHKSCIIIIPCYNSLGPVLPSVKSVTLVFPMHPQTSEQ